MLVFRILEVDFPNVFRILEDDFLWKVNLQNAEFMNNPENFQPYIYIKLLFQPQSCMCSYPMAKEA